MAATGTPTAALSSEIRLCGRLVVRLDGEDMKSALSGRQGRMLFAYLATSLFAGLLLVWLGSRVAGAIRPI